MRISKPKLYKPNIKFFDYNTNKEFPESDLLHHTIWYKREYDQNGNIICKEYSDGYWEKHTYDQRGKVTYYENSAGYRFKKEYNTDGHQIRYENCDGIINNL